MPIIYMLRFIEAVKIHLLQVFFFCLHFFRSIVTSKNIIQ